MSVRKRRWTTALGEEREAWVVDYTDTKGKRRLRTFDKKKLADQFEAKVTIEVSEGTHVPDAASITIEEAGKLWVQTVELAGRERSTIDQYQQHLKLHIGPLIGNVKLTRFSAPAARSFEDELLTTGRSGALTKKIMVSLGSLLADAMERGLVGRNVVREMRRRRGSADHRADKRAKGRLKVGEDIPTNDEIRRILGALRGRTRPSLMTSTFTGLRSSEVRGLIWKLVDLKKGKIYVRQRVDKYKKVGKPKSDAGERDLPIPPILVNTLKAWKLSVKAKGDEDFVFPAEDGGARVHNSELGCFKEAQIRAGVTKPVLDADGNPVLDEKGNPVVTAKYTGLHALRHWYASWCINRKVDGGLELPPKIVQYRLGHSTITLTLDTYGHLFPSTDDGSEMAEAEAFLMGSKD